MHSHNTVDAHNTVEASRTLYILSISNIQVIKAVEITICDCNNSKKDGFLKVNRHCELEKPIDPEYVKYEITTVRSEKLHFTGHFCSAKTVFQKTTVHIDKTRKFHQRES